MTLRTVALVVAAVLVNASYGTAFADAPAGEPPSTIQVVMVGEIPKPGAVTLPAASRLVDALAAQGFRLRQLHDSPAGMPLTEAADLTAPCPWFPAPRASTWWPNLRMVVLTRTIDGKLVSYGIDAVRGAAEPASDPVLRDGDRVFVPSCLRGSPWKPRQVS